MQKKGQTEVLTTSLLFEVLAGFLLGGILIYAVMTTGNMEGFSEDYLKVDHELLLNIIKSVPGDVEIKYNTGGYRYEDGDFHRGSFTELYTLTITKEDGKITQQKTGKYEKTE